MVSLHVHLQLHQLDLSKLTGILRPISRIEKEMEFLPYITDPAKLTSLVSPEVIGNSVLWSPTLATFTVDMLFKSLSSPDGEELHQWYRSYNGIVSLPAIMYFALHL